jgi:hypothetical protein
VRTQIFGGIALQKRKQVRAQHGVSTDHFVDMGGSNDHICQSRLQYAKAEGEFIVEGEHVNPFVGHRMQGKLGKMHF